VDLNRLGDQAWADVLRWAPKSTYSHVVGFMADRAVPRPLRKHVYTAFAKKVGVDLDDVERPLTDYPSLGAFFTRRLRAGARPIDMSPDTIVSPCDGVVAQVGEIAGGQLIQAKGLEYPIFGLLADRAGAARFEGGTYVVIYLSPKDYHRVHTCCEGKVTGFQHIPGALFPVNDHAVQYIGALYTRNERLVTYQDSPAGEIATVMVGATAVGRISVTYDSVRTHSSRGRPGPRVRLPSPRPVARGEELGTFHLGSTVVLLFEPRRVVLERLVPQQKVRLGEAIARRVPTRASGGVSA
jgi:phosphatidylserine decarboxylase